MPVVCSDGGIEVTERGRFVGSVSCVYETAALVVEVDGSVAATLRGQRQGVALVTAIADLCGAWDLTRVTRILSDFADTALDRAIEVEDVSAALITFANRAIATVTNSALSPRQETYVRLDYQLATVELTHLYSYTKDHWRFTPAPGAPADLAAAWADFPPDVGSTHEAQLADLLSHLDAGTRPHTAL